MVQLIATDHQRQLHKAVPSSITSALVLQTGDKLQRWGLDNRRRSSAQWITGSRRLQSYTSVLQHILFDYHHYYYDDADQLYPHNHNHYYDYYDSSCRVRLRHNYVTDHVNHHYKCSEDHNYIHQHLYLHNHHHNNHNNFTILPDSRRFLSEYHKRRSVSGDSRNQLCSNLWVIETCDSGVTEGNCRVEIRSSSST